MKDFKLNKRNLGQLIQSLTEMVLTGKDYRVSIKEWRSKRGLTANAQYYVWLPTISKFYGEDVEYIRKWMKHDIAWPILERGGCDYSVKMRYMLEQSGYGQLSQARKINMVDMFGITRFMNSSQHTELRDQVQIYWAKQGLQLDYLNKGQ